MVAVPALAKPSGLATGQPSTRLLNRLEHIDKIQPQYGLVSFLVLSTQMTPFESPSQRPNTRSFCALSFQVSIYRTQGDGSVTYAAAGSKQVENASDCKSLTKADQNKRCCLPQTDRWTAFQLGYTPPVFQGIMGTTHWLPLFTVRLR